MNENITQEVVDVGHATGARPTTYSDDEKAEWWHFEPYGR
jgi:hypothetical protein